MNSVRGTVQYTNVVNTVLIWKAEALFVTSSCTGLAEINVLRLRSDIARGLDVSNNVDSLSDSLRQASSCSLDGFLTVDSTRTNMSWYIVRCPRTTHSATCTCLSKALSTDFMLSAFAAGFFSVCITRSTCF